MEAKQCPRGHYYDSKKFASCPFCKDSAMRGGAPAGKIKPSSNAAFKEVPPTMPVTEPQMQPNPAYPNVDLSKTMPVSPGAGVPNAPQFADEGVTKSLDNVNLGFVPTVGWVICISGPHKGKDFRLLTGYNKIGRNPDMAICLPSDDQVTRDSHAIIAYEPNDRKYFAAGDKNMIYLNGKFMMGMQELHAHDVIKVGATELLFVPLCGDTFNWE